MFTHASEQHLWGNMIVLHCSCGVLPRDYGLGNFLVTYFVGHLAGIEGNVALAGLHRAQWKARLRRSEGDLVCNYWWCESTGYNTLAKMAGRGLAAGKNAANLAMMEFNEWAVRVGASAGVYAVLGASFVTRYVPLLVSPSGAPRALEANDLVGLTMVSWDLFTMFQELGRVPWTMDSLMNTLADGVDHTAHAGGFLFGVCAAMLFYRSKRR
mmetsp:Transcript_13213/g.39303  ORF Transcript_13213/g.39303 Transcript_13213/m.39303 type:complete len:212 (-) Transcript_13213:54-689(-)